MKKLYYIFLLPVLMLLASVTACGDYDMDEFSDLHVLTDDEIDEIRRQDSIAEALRNSINADLILEYTVTDYLSASNWTNVTFEIDLEAIGELFGLTADEVKAGINMDDGAPNITGFAINNTTHQDYTVNRTTTNGAWGHWFDKNGDAGTWADLTALGTLGFFCEWQDDYFAVGQNPGAFTEPVTLHAYECLSYEGKRVAIHVIFNLIERGEVTAGIVAEHELTVEMNPASNYDAVTAEFDLASVLSALGISDISEATVIGVNEDGSYAQESTANGGFWYNEAGYVDVYANGAFFVDYYGMDASNVAEYPEDAYTFYVGQMPNLLSGGYTADAKIGFTANDRIVIFTVHLVITAYEDPETPPAGEPTTDGVVNITMDWDWNNTFAATTYDVKDALREAFKMTTYQIHQAGINGDLRIYCGSVSEEEPSYTGGSLEYWMNGEGAAASYGEGVVYCGLRTTETSLELGAGNHPENCLPNTTVTTTYYITCNGGMVTLNLTFNVGEAAE